MTPRSIFRLQLQLHNSMTPLAGCNVINVPGYNATTFECDNSAPTAIKTRPIPTRQLQLPLLVLRAKVIVQKKTRAEGLSAICNKSDGQTSWNRLVLYQLGDDQREREDGGCTEIAACRNLNVSTSKCSVQTDFFYLAEKSKVEG